MPIGTDQYSTSEQSFTKIVKNGNAWTAYPKVDRIFIFGLETKTSYTENCGMNLVDLADTWIWS